MDKAKILKLCDTIEMIIATICDTGYTLQEGDEEAICERIKIIAAEIREPPKTNADRIRQMTDEELVMTLDTDCNRCAKSENCKLYGDPVSYGICVEGNIEWLKQEAETDDKR